MGKFGHQLLATQICEYLSGEWDWMLQPKSGAVLEGDTPIEQLLFLALQTRCALSACEYNDLCLARNQEQVEGLKKERFSGLRLIVWPQAAIKKRRVDFAFYALDFRKNNSGLWRTLLVECDGHDFHERTKDQAARDRSKDRAAVLAGFECFRFTGSEIWRDPWGCAQQITEWAAKGIY